jgi:Flp pilus assembly protein TadD
VDTCAPPGPAFESESEAHDLFVRGMAFLRSRHPAQAAMLLSRALRLEPGRNSIREALGRALFALGEHEAAAQAFSAIVEAVPVDHYASYALGRCLLELGRLGEARTRLRLAVAMAPQQEEYRARLAALEAQLAAARA